MIGCTKCSLASGRNQIVYGQGHYPNTLMLIGEAPGYKEDQTGIPFVGKSGILLRQTLFDCGLSYGYLTNVVKCRPYNNNTPLPEQINTCTKYFLFKELKTVEPKYIITIGKIASNIFVDGNINDLSGKPYYLNGVYIFPIYHPSYILRSGKEDLFKLHMRQIKQYTLTY